MEKLLSATDVLQWASAYDVIKYPVSLYQELVVAGKELPEKMVLMGAWKTGSIKKKGIGDAYVDDLGSRYGYTLRWGSHAPVGYDTWLYVADHYDQFKEQVPIVFPAKEPDIVKQLIARKGFGYIWALFTLHCMYPRVYPLYDQHVYRTYRSLASGGTELPRSADNHWQAYTAYNNYFAAQCNSVQMEFDVVDRAIWSYGKWLKKSSKKTVDRPIW
jgi:hypothetical protein